MLTDGGVLRHPSAAIIRASMADLFQASLKLLLEYGPVLARGRTRVAARLAISQFFFKFGLLRTVLDRRLWCGRAVKREDGANAAHVVLRSALKY